MLTTSHINAGSLQGYITSIRTWERGVQCLPPVTSMRVAFRGTSHPSVHHIHPDLGTWSPVLTTSHLNVGSLQGYITSIRTWERGVQCLPPVTSTRVAFRGTSHPSVHHIHPDLGTGSSVLTTSHLNAGSLQGYITSIGTSHLSGPGNVESSAYHQSPQCG